MFEKGKKSFRNLLLLSELSFVLSALVTYVHLRMEPKKCAMQYFNMSTDLNNRELVRNRLHWGH